MHWRHHSESNYIFKGEYEHHHNEDKSLCVTRTKSERTYLVHPLNEYKIVDGILWVLSQAVENMTVETTSGSYLTEAHT